MWNSNLYCVEGVSLWPSREIEKIVTDISCLSVAKARKAHSGVTIQLGRPSYQRMRLLATIAVTGSLLAISACLAPEDCPGDYANGVCFDGDYGLPTSTPRIEFARLGDGNSCGLEGCSTAVAGTNTVVVTTGGMAMEADATNGFTVTKTSLVEGPYQVYDLRAPPTEAQANFGIWSQKTGTIAVEIASYAIYDISIVAPTWGNSYSQDFYEVPTTNPRFVVALWSRENSASFNNEYEPSRIIDTTLHSPNTNLTQLAWDTFEISAGPGLYTVELESDALGTVELRVQVVGGRL